MNILLITKKVWKNTIPLMIKKNNKLAEEYRKLATQEENVIFGGRLAEYKYYDMDDVIKSAINIYESNK